MRLIAVLLVLALVSPVSAQAVEQEPTYVQERTLAPFSGMLFPSDIAMRWAQRIQFLEHQLTIDVQHEQAIAQVRYDAYEQRLELLRQQLENERTAAREALARTERRRLVQKPGFWYAAGVLTTVLLIVTTGSILNHIGS